MASQPEPTPLTESSPFPAPIITTPRLIIRCYHPKDVASSHKQAGPASIHKYMTLAFPYPYTLKHAQDWVAMNLKPPFNNFAICLSSAPELLIGGIGLKPGGDVNSHTAEVGYWIGEDYWGKGLTTEALAAFDEWALTERERPDGKKFTRLFATAVEGNTASMRCLEKCGYKAEGILKGHVEKYGEVSDEHIFGLTKKDWEEWKSSKVEAEK